MENQIKTIPIKIGMQTLVGVNCKIYPVSRGNCFGLIDTDGTVHQVVNFYAENLKEWVSLSGQQDIKVRCIPKSDDIWEIADDRIPQEWYSKKYCTVCTPLRMLSYAQRKEYVKGKTFKKYTTVNKNGDAIQSLMEIYNIKKL